MTWTLTRRRRTCAQLHSSWRTPPSPATSRRAPQLRALLRAPHAAPARGASSSCKIKRGVKRQAAAHTGLARAEADRRMRICTGAFVQQVEVYLDGDLPAELPELSDEYVCGTQSHISPGLNLTRTALLHCTDAASPVADVGVGPACSSPRRSHAAVRAQVHRQVERLAQRDRYGNPGDLQVSAGPEPIPPARVVARRTCARQHTMRSRAAALNSS